MKNFAKRKKQKLDFIGDNMTFLDFFAGIGGFHTGMELAGHKCIGFCEFDKYAVASYTSMYLITDEQREYLANLDKRKRQKEILKDEYRNGIWYFNDVRTVTGSSVPKADCWCFGAPCQSFSIAGKRAGLDGESGLIREIFRILGEIKEENRPEWLIYENVKGMLSSNRGFDYLAIQLAMDELGYDIEWQLFNSKNWGVPQNRERVYTIGHLRIKGAAKIFPITGTNGENSIPVGIIGHRDGYRRNMQIFDPKAITEALDTAAGGGRGHHTIVLVAFGIDYNVNGEEREIANCLKARYDAGVTNFRQDGTAVAVTISYDRGLNEIKDGIMPTLTARDYKGVNFRDMGAVAVPVSFADGKIIKEIDTAHCLSANGPAKEGIHTHQTMNRVIIPVLTPERANKRQNGRRFKEDGDEAFTLTAQDKHGVAIGIEMSGHNCSENEKGVANCLNANDQRKIFGANQTRTMVGHLVDGEEVINSDEKHPGMYVQLDEDCVVWAVWYEKYQCYIAIRKLLPLETFRLQGFSDELFNRAEFVNFDSQLFKQSGNSVTVNVVYEIAKAIKDVNIKK